MPQDDVLFQTRIATAVDGIVVDDQAWVELCSGACERPFGFHLSIAARYEASRS